MKHPSGLMSLNDVAEYVGKHPQQLREYFANGMLAEPACIITAGKGKYKYRFFTRLEADLLARDFAHAAYGEFAERKKRAAPTKRKRK